MPCIDDIDALKAAYDADGFVVLRGFLSAQEVQELSDRTDAVMAGFEFHPSYPGVRKELQKVDAWFKQQFEDGAHVPLVAKLIEDEPAPASAAFFDKPVGSSVEISQHVDGQGSKDGATLWIALDAADRSNGCLCYVRGSHRSRHDAEALRGFSEDSEGAVAIEAAPGDAVVHSARVVHWSRKSACTSRRRRAVSYFYWAAACLGRAAEPATPEALAAELGPLDVAAGAVALEGLERDWATWPVIAQMFKEDPIKFMAGLKMKDPEAFDILVAASRL